MERVQTALAVIVALVVAAGVPWLVLAAGDERSMAEQSLATLEGDPHTKQLCAEPIAKARVALERAHRMRTAGDDCHARLAEGLAYAWARMAEELVRADATETRSQAAASIAADAGAHVEHERATLEQQLAENGRLSAELAKAEARDGGNP